MPVRSWLLVLCLTSAASGVLQARGQPDSSDFISIDCGLPGTTSYVDDTTKLRYVPDADFTQAGTNHNISADYITPGLSRIYHDVRSFPDVKRSCYTLRSLVAGGKYLLRASFMYGNYDGLNRPPVFELYVGVNFWTTVAVSHPGTPVIPVEAIVVVPDDFVHVCMVNNGSGTPFISGLELRPLKNLLYPAANATQGLVLFTRGDLGPTDETDITRYPDDPYDRIWIPKVDTTEWTEISTTSTVQQYWYYWGHDEFEAPSKVMQTAIRPRDTSENIELSWDSKPQPQDPTPRYIVIIHFSELLHNVSHQLFFYFNGKYWYNLPVYYLTKGNVYTTVPVWGYTRFNFVINTSSANPTLPPIINALEVYSVISTNNTATDSHDESAITEIRDNYGVQKNWMGDPCNPRNLAWDGLRCSYAISTPSRITYVNMSFGGLHGDISFSFANLKAVENIDLSNNNLTGSIPDVLSQLTSLTILDLTGNQLSGSIPPGLLKRIQDGSLNLRYGNNPNLCTNGDSCQTGKEKSKLAIYIAISVPLFVLIVSVVVLLFCLLRRRQGAMNNSMKPQRDETPMNVQTGDVNTSLRLDNRRFTYTELEMITKNFQRVIGRGGFGYVFNGSLEDGTQVAVKLRSQSSNQGVKEFLTEAQILTRIHHKNLVTMIGYCKDGECMALVYEYMSEGSLQEHIAAKHVTWRQRLRIALESAQGLEYLHEDCNPPLIHRDVKATNILLNAKLEAKIADFGLSKVFNRDIDTHISTNMLVGTPGYVDPEYQATTYPTTKSDVFSFGVVVLELITGKPPILRDQEPISIIQWARERLARGDIEAVVDPRMLGDHDINSVWKATEVALMCTAQSSMQRPTMTTVVAQLQECLELEEGRLDQDSGYYMDANDQATNVSESSIGYDRPTSSLLKHNSGRIPTAITGPDAR